MSRSTSTRRLRALLAAALLGVSGASVASGDDGYMESEFTPEHYVPAAELPAYAAGNLGVVAPSYWRIYHFLAYRVLTGHGLSSQELALLKVRDWRVGESGADYDYTDAEEKNGVGSWLIARNAVVGADKTKVRIEGNAGDFSVFVNCPRDAFETAAKTLAQRIGQGGQKWSAIWLANQDAVFANCAAPVTLESRRTPMAERPFTMPAALPPDAPGWLAGDHAYQGAAALFYAGRYDDARERFLAIGKDAKSPWQSLGKYLAARCLLRKASMMPPAPMGKGNGAANELLATARTEMLALVPGYAPARGLLGWIDFRLRPEARRHELSAELAVEKITGATPQRLSDYLLLLDRMEDAATVADADSMTAWIRAMQASDERGGEGAGDDKDRSRREAIALARAQWNRTHAALWLAPLLTHARAGELKPEEIAAAAAEKDDAPAYMLLQYHLARLALVGGKAGDADSIVSAMLRKPLPAYTRNRWLRMKMLTAQNAEAFFAAAPRIPAAQDQRTPIPDEGKTLTDTGVRFDEDLRWHLQRDFSLAQLVRLKPLVPAQYQSWLNEMMWTRAVIFGEFAIADALTETLASGRGTTSHLYLRYRQAATPREKKDAALVILGNAPELTPWVTDRDAAPKSRSAVAWTCGYNQAAPQRMDWLAPSFLSDEERAQAAQEQQRLWALPRRSSYLIPPVIEWAKNNKADPEAPKVLHLLVASTRNECNGVEGGAPRSFSRDAFRFLHAQFPTSEWALRTRYYY